MKGALLLFEIDIRFNSLGAQYDYNYAVISPKKYKAGQGGGYCHDGAAVVREMLLASAEVEGVVLRLSPDDPTTDSFDRLYCLARPGWMKREVKKMQRTKACYTKRRVY